MGLIDGIGKVLDWCEKYKIGEKIEKGFEYYDKYKSTFGNTNESRYGNGTNSNVNWNSSTSFEDWYNMNYGYYQAADIAQKYGGYVGPGKSTTTSSDTSMYKYQYYQNMFKNNT